MKKDFTRNLKLVLFIIIALVFGAGIYFLSIYFMLLKGILINFIRVFLTMILLYGVYNLYKVTEQAFIKIKNKFRK